MDFIDYEPRKCKFCESTRFVKAGKSLRVGNYVQRYVCKNCGKYFVMEE